jgi:hypothetical protein
LRPCLLADGLANDRKCLLTDFSVRSNVIGVIQIKFVDFVLGHELVNVDCALALDCDSFELLGVQFDVLPLTNLVALDDVCGIDFIPGARMTFWYLMR